MKEKKESVTLHPFEIEESRDPSVGLLERRRKGRIIKAALEKRKEHDRLCESVLLYAKRCSVILTGF